MSFKENAFPHGKGKLNLISGTRTDNLVYLCVIAGTLTITWSDDTTTAIDLISGDAVDPESTIKSVTITSGTFHVA